MADTSSRTAISNVFFLVLRRMRFPLILILAIYGFCIIGMTFMPGIDEAGNPTDGLTLFESFYVMSYTGTTIGFGELPVPYSGAQRLWMSMSIYLTVIAWTYSIMSMITLMQDRGFQNAVRQYRFTSKVRSMREPFYIVAGCGETGMLVCHGLDRLNYRFVMIEQSSERLDELKLEEFRFDPPMMIADASQASILKESGLGKPNCRGVMALAEDDTTNRSIAVAVRLMNPEVPVLARVRDMDTNESQMGPFVGDTVINPFERFAQHLAEAVSSPQRYRLRDTLTGLPGHLMPEAQRPPRGRWIVVGYGRFGRAIVDHLRMAEIRVTVVDNDAPTDDEIDVEGSGTDQASLQSAGIDKAVGLVAGTDNDLTNLAIAVTARDMNPDIFLVTRQNQSGNDPLFKSFQDDLTMVPSRIVAQEFLALITTPLVSRFLKTIGTRDETWCESLLGEIERVWQGKIPEVWSIPVALANTEPVVRALQTGKTVRLGDLLRNPRARLTRLNIKVLMVVRADQMICLPADDLELHVGDQLLLASDPSLRGVVRAAICNENTFNYVLTGIDISGGFIWRSLAKREKVSDPQLPEPFDPGYIAPEPVDLPEPEPVEPVLLEEEPEPEVEWEPVAQPGEEEDLENGDASMDDLDLEDEDVVPWEPLDPDEEPPEVDPNFVVEDPDD